MPCASPAGVRRVRVHADPAQPLHAPSIRTSVRAPPGPVPWSRRVKAAFLTHALLSLALAVAAIAFLTTALRVHAIRGRSWALLAVLFLVTWAGGIWVAPFGPPIGAIYWLPFTLIAVLLATLLAAVVPPELRTPRDIVTREEELETGLGFFFWILVVGLVVAIVLRYLR